MRNGREFKLAQVIIACLERLMRQFIAGLELCCITLIEAVKGGAIWPPNSVCLIDVDYMDPSCSLWHAFAIQLERYYFALQQITSRFSNRTSYSGDTSFGFNIFMYICMEFSPSSGYAGVVFGKDKQINIGLSNLQDPNRNIVFKLYGSNFHCCVVPPCPSS